MNKYKNLINKEVQIYRGNLKGSKGKVIKQVGNRIYIEKLKMYVKQLKTDEKPKVRYLYVDISNVGIVTDDVVKKLSSAKKLKNTHKLKQQVVKKRYQTSSFRNRMSKR